MFHVLKRLGFTLPFPLMDKSADDGEGGDADNGKDDDDGKSGSSKTKTEENSDSPPNNDNSDATPVLDAIQSLTEILSTSSKTANKDAKARRLENERILAALTSTTKEDDDDPSELANSQAALATATALLQDSQKTLVLEREAMKLNFVVAEEAAKFAMLLYPDEIKIEKDDDGKMVVTGAVGALEKIIKTYPAMMKGSRKPKIDGEDEFNNSSKTDDEAMLRSKYL